RRRERHLDEERRRDSASRARQRPRERAKTEDHRRAREREEIELPVRVHHGPRGRRDDVRERRAACDAEETARGGIRVSEEEHRQPRTRREERPDRERAREEPRVREVPPEAFELAPEEIEED